MTLIPLVKTRRWGCLATSFAMVIPCTEEQFYEVLGHDGGEIVPWHTGVDGDDPAIRRGIHIQEGIFVAQEFGLSVTPVELFPQILALGNKTIPVHYFNDPGRNAQRFDHVLKFTRGVLTGRGQRNHHAMAYDHGLIYDPDTGQPYDGEPFTQASCRKFHPQCAWILT